MLRSAARLFTQGQRLVSAARPLAPQVRTFAETTFQEPTVEVHGIHGRYAMALFHAALKKGDLNKIDKDLEEIQALAQGNKVFAQFLADPSVPKKEKMAALTEILSGINVSETTKSLFEVLAENNRLKEVPKITATFLDIVASARGQVKAIVTTAQKLSSKELADIKKGLDALLKPGQSLILNEQVEPAIIGGIVIDVGDKHIDLSILTRVKRIQQLLMETV